MGKIDRGEIRESSWLREREKAKERERGERREREGKGEKGERREREKRRDKKSPAPMRTQASMATMVSGIIYKPGDEGGSGEGGGDKKRHHQFHGSWRKQSVVQPRMKHAAGSSGIQFGIYGAKLFGEKRTCVCLCSVDEDQFLIKRLAQRGVKGEVEGRIPPACI